MVHSSTNLFPVTSAWEFYQIIGSLSLDISGYSFELTNFTMSINDRVIETSVPFSQIPVAKIIRTLATLQYPDTLPGPDEPLDLITLYQSQHYATKRDTHAIISRAEQLAPSEISQIATELNELVKMYHPYTIAYPPTQGDLQYFLTAIFWGWRSDLRIGEKPVIRAPTFNDRALRVGYFQHDLEPVAGFGPDGLKNRHKDDNAYNYVYIDHQAQTVNVAWKDGNCLDIQPQDVSLIRPFWRLDDRIIILFDHYEDCEQLRVMDHNWNVSQPN
jgi:hypothetical protein